MDSSINLGAFGSGGNGRTTKRQSPVKPPPTNDISSEEKDLLNSISLVQWAVCGPNTYKPVSSTFPKLESGVYSISVSQYHGIVYQRKNICVDDLLRFPDSLSDKILQEITTFWGKEEKFKERGFLHRRGYLLHGPAGCHAKGTKIIMYDGTFKNVEDIIVGDMLMGLDSKPRRVLELKRGKDKMVKIIPNKGTPFVVNENHILHLNHTIKKFYIDMSVKDYQKRYGNYKTHKTDLKLCYSNLIKFSKKDLIIPPYILGVWLGDGNKNEPSIVSADTPIIKEWKKFSNTIGLNVKKCNIRYYMSDGNKSTINIFTELLKKLNIYKNKHIPQNYLISDKNQRLELLAGLIDTDGTYKKSNKCFEFRNKNKNIVDGVVYLCRSLGLSSYVHPAKSFLVYNGKLKNYGIIYTVTISGNTNIIPTRLKRKQAKRRISKKNSLMTGFKIESIGTDDYYGFNLSDDHLYLTSDFMIHHNSGKTCLVQQIIYDIVTSGGLVFQCNNHPAIFNDGLTQYRKVESNRPVVCLFEDIDAIVDEHGEDEILTLLDGENQIDRVLNIATTNYPEKLDRRLVARPRRFDRVLEIGMPTDEVRRMYFNKKLNVSESELDKWVSSTGGFSFAACAELVISVCCFEKPFEESIEILKEMMTVQLNSRKYNVETNSAGFAGLIQNSK